MNLLRRDKGTLTYYLWGPNPSTPRASGIDTRAAHCRDLSLQHSSTLRHACLMVGQTDVCRARMMWTSTQEGHLALSGSLDVLNLPGSDTSQSYFVPSHPARNRFIVKTAQDLPHSRISQGHQVPRSHDSPA